MTNKYNSEVSHNAYFQNKEGFKNNLSKIFDLIKSNPKKYTREDILAILKLKPGNGARLTDLQDAGYISGELDYSLSTPANRYYAVVGEFNPDDFTSEKIEARRYAKTGSNKNFDLNAKIGEIFRKTLKNTDMNNEDVIRFINFMRDKDTKYEAGQISQANYDEALKTAKKLWAGIRDE